MKKCSKFSILKKVLALMTVQIIIHNDPWLSATLAHVQVENNYKKDFCETSQMCIDVPFIELNGDGIAWVAAITCFQDMHNERFKLLITQH